MRYSQHLKKTISQLASQKAFNNYLEIKKNILEMIDISSNKQLPSIYWQQELQGFEYMFDASPLIIQKLRHHCYHLTGIYEYNYRKHHEHQKLKFQQKLKYLKSKDKKDLLVEESKDLGGFGFKIKNRLINLDTLKFYECLITLDHQKILNQFKNQQILMEIGPGWGGFIYQFKKLFPKTTCLLVDLPQTLLFSSTYLTTLFPKSKYLFLKTKFELKKISDIKKYDFVFIPDYLFNELNFTPPEIAVNMVSFQEMTSQQVNLYIEKLKKWGCRKIYSLNRNRSPNNNQLTSVEGILKTHYKTENINVFQLQYLEFPSKPKNIVINKIKKFALKKIRPKNSLYQYQHLLSTYYE